MKTWRMMVASLAFLMLAGAAFGQRAFSSTRTIQKTVADYRSVQEALTANPGRVLYLPAGDYEISKKIQIHGDGSGLFGPGRIIQNNPAEPIIEIEKGAGIQLRDLTLTRAPGKQDTKAEGILVTYCRNLVLDNLQVLDNRTRSGAIAVRNSTNTQVRNCLVQNYTWVAD